jgi:dTMP kinase
MWRLIKAVRLLGRLIVFEGIDGSGKSTQSRIVRERLENSGIRFRSVTFPRYDKPSAALIKMYLGGEFGTDPSDVNPYAASCFYAVDRYASFKQDWKDYYTDGGLIVTDRYTTSNAIHQGSKLPEAEREGFFRWLYDFEFNLMGLPRPDAVIYMDIPFELALRRIAERDLATGSTGDIHEKDRTYLEHCCQCGRQAADYFGWRCVSSVKDGTERTVNDINNEIFDIIKDLL